MPELPLLDVSNARLEYSNEKLAHDKNHYFRVTDDRIDFPNFEVRTNVQEIQKLYDKNAAKFIESLQIVNADSKNIIWHCENVDCLYNLITGGRSAGAGFSEADKTLIIDRFIEWCTMLRESGVTLPTEHLPADMQMRGERSQVPAARQSVGTDNPYCL